MEKQQPKQNQRRLAGEAGHRMCGKRRCVDCLASLCVSGEDSGCPKYKPLQGTDPGSRAKARAIARTSPQPRCRPLPLFPTP